MATQFDAVLKDALGDLIQGATVAFSYRLMGAPSFTSAGSAVTDPSGAAAVTVDLPGGIYDLMAAFGGTSTLLKSSVEVTYDVVTQAQSQLTAAVAPASPRPGQSIVVDGALTSSGAGVSGAQVDFELNGAPAGSVTTGSGGAYSGELGPLQPGTYTLAVSYAGDAGHLPASHQLTFKVLGGGGGGTAGVVVVIVAAAAVGTALVVARARR